MTVVIATLIVLGAIVLLNLLLTVGIIRKLRAYDKERQSLPGPGWPPPSPGLPVGAAIPAFAASDRRGNPVNGDDLLGRRTLIGFFSSDCESCVLKAPDFVVAANGARADDIAAIAVVTTVQRDPDELLAALGDGVTVVVERGRGDVAAAFAISAYPWFFLAGPDGAVSASAADPGACLARLVRA